MMFSTANTGASTKYYDWIFHCPCWNLMEMTWPWEALFVCAKIVDINYIICIVWYRLSVFIAKERVVSRSMEYLMLFQTTEIKPSLRIIVMSRNGLWCDFHPVRPSVCPFSTYLLSHPPFSHFNAHLHLWYWTHPQRRSDRGATLWSKSEVGVRQPCLPWAVYIAMLK